MDVRGYLVEQLGMDVLYLDRLFHSYNRTLFALYFVCARTLFQPIKNVDDDVLLTRLIDKLTDTLM